MTREEFQARYRILRQVTDGTVRTCHAQARSGAVVMVHYLEGTPSERRDLLARVHSLRPEARSRVVNLTEVDGTPVVVTRFIFDLVSLPEWLAAHAGTEPAPAEEPPAPTPTVAPLPAPEPPPPPQPAAESGGFTGLFQPVARPPEARPPAPPAVPPVPLDRPSAPGEAQPEAGSFTQLFQRGTAPAPPRAPSPAPPAAAGPEDPSGFTDLFRAASPPVVGPPATPHPEVPATPPRHEAPMPSADPFPAPPSPPLEPPAGSGGTGGEREPGPFTRVFGASSRGEPAARPLHPVDEPAPYAPPPAPGAPRPLAEPHDGERYLDRLHTVRPPPAAPPPPSAGAPWEVAPASGPPPAPYLPPSGPSDYTRVVSASAPSFSSPPPRQEVPPPAIPVPSAPPRWLRRLLLALVWIAVALIIAVLAWTVWPRGGETAGEQAATVSVLRTWAAAPPARAAAPQSPTVRTPPGCAPCGSLPSAGPSGRAESSGSSA
jgi:hypothetical protein